MASLATWDCYVLVNCVPGYVGLTRERGCRRGSREGGLGDLQHVTESSLQQVKRMIRYAAAGRAE